MVYKPLSHIICSLRLLKIIIYIYTRYIHIHSYIQVDTRKKYTIDQCKKKNII